MDGFAIYIKCSKCRTENITINIEETNNSSPIKFRIVGEECIELKCNKCGNDIIIYTGGKPW